MLDSRLPLALDGGGLEWPAEGTIAVFNPAPEADLDGVPQDRSEIIHDLYPAHASWAPVAMLSRSRGRGVMQPHWFACRAPNNRHVP